MDLTKNAKDFFYSISSSFFNSSEVKKSIETNKKLLGEEVKELNDLCKESEAEILELEKKLGISLISPTSSKS